MGKDVKVFTYKGTVFFLGSEENSEFVRDAFQGQKMKVRRLSSIEFNEDLQEWEVIVKGETFPRFSSVSRQACHDWEEEFFNQEFATNPEKYAIAS